MDFWDLGGPETKVQVGMALVMILTYCNDGVRDVPSLAKTASSDGLIIARNLCQLGGSVVLYPGLLGERECVCVCVCAGAIPGFC